MTKQQRAELRAVAEAARTVMATDDDWYGERFFEEDVHGPLDAKHIATFDPPTVLALLACIDEYEAALAFYADTDHWDMERLHGPLEDYGDVTLIEKEYGDKVKPSGKRARQVLAKWADGKGAL